MIPLVSTCVRCCSHPPQAHYSLFFFSSRRRHTRYIGDWSSDVCSSDLPLGPEGAPAPPVASVEDRRHPYLPRSEERRVGKECRSRGPPDPSKKKTVWDYKDMWHCAGWEATIRLSERTPSERRREHTESS